MCAVRVGCLCARWPVPVAAAAAVIAQSGCESFLESPASHTGHLQQARQFLDQGLTDSAWASFGLALEANPKLVDAHVGMGWIYHDWNKDVLAHRSFETATGLDPTHYEAHYGLGLTKQVLGWVQDAVAVYLRALALRPSSFEVNHHLAGAYIMLDRIEEALPYAEIATRLNPDHQGAWANLAATYRHTGDYEKAVNAYRRAAELGDPADPILLGMADAHIQLGRFERAVVVLRNQNRRSPSATAYERLGYCQFKLRQFDDALASFRAAMSIDQKDTAALNGLGACLMTLHIQSKEKFESQRHDALKAWQRSIALRPNQPRIATLIKRYGAETKKPSRITHDPAAIRDVQLTAPATRD